MSNESITTYGMTATTSDLARLTVHRADVVHVDEHGAMYGATRCGIDAGVYATDQPEHVTCSSCITASINPTNHTGDEPR